MSLRSNKTRLNGELTRKSTAGQALYRHYRPKKFDDVIGQELVTKTLAGAIASGRISHAYLLAGPKGVGKTSVARIIAHRVNNLPYIDESIHLDIIEIDAASNRRIDEIRDIREKVHIAPTSAKYKVYIIDEVHMLTKEAFNALLKTLEEPPAHCIFILATTEAHKLPPTIISRTQRFNFKPIADHEALDRLKKIAKNEKIDIKTAALELLVKHGDGSFRDSLSLLDQLRGKGQTITEQAARRFLGLPPDTLVLKLIELVHRGDSNGTLELLNNLRETGISPATVAAQLSEKLRSQIVAADANHKERNLALLKNLLSVSSAKQPYELLEITLLESAIAVPHTLALPTIKPIDKVSSPIKARSKKAKESSFNLDIWPEVLDEIKKRAASIYTALRLAKPEIHGTILTLTFPFALHKNKVEQARHVRLVSDVIFELAGAVVEIKCVLTEPPSQKEQRHTHKLVRSAAEESTELATISNIFGSAEMLK